MHVDFAQLKTLIGQSSDRVNRDGLLFFIIVFFKLYDKLKIIFYMKN